MADTLTSPQGNAGAGAEGVAQAQGDQTQAQTQTQGQGQSDQAQAQGDQAHGDQTQVQAQGTQNQGQGQSQDGKPDPAAYVWTPPEDLKEVPLNDKGIEGFKQFAAQQGMTPQQFQASLELYARQTKESFQAFKAANEANVESLAKEWGGEYDARISTAKKGLLAFSDKEALKVLEKSGAAYHPAIVKMFEKIGKTISEDSTGKGDKGGKGGKAEKLVADILYPETGKS